MKIIINGKPFNCPMTAEESAEIAEYLLRSEGIIKAATIYKKNDIIVDLDKVNNLINK